MASTTTATAVTAATATMPLIDEAWKVAQKLRAAIHKELDHIQKDGQGKNEIARFEKVEKLMENYRLACIETIWPDIRAAKEKSAEDTLWQTHTQVTKAYRKVLARLQGHDNAVLRRKLERLYSTYLKTAQYFYKGYLQRVCARYDMKDLRRIARQADLQEMPVPDADKVDPAAAHLDEIVKESCHKMLIYLGDLSRYRTLMRPKDRKWDAALSYYFLANELIPESGYGHHQCGVIYVETEDHLEVVYHLYRALACDMPHPNAPTNLKREFNDLQKRKSTGIKHALVNWFVKLHAFYFQGKEFAERKELESEVDHRLAVSMKTGTGLGSDKDLLKIILINISAYVVAKEKIRTEWTNEGSKSCELILLLNIRTIQAISRLLGDETADLIQDKTVETSAKKSNSTAQPGTPSKFTPAFSRALPLLRVYMTWLCSCGSDLVEYQQHLEPHFGNMCTTLSNTLTLLFELLVSDTTLGNKVSWRFPEDEITLGLKCLNGPDLHDGCQLCYDAFTRQPKPRLEDVSGADHTTDDVTFTRALDVVSCAIDLAAPESMFPFTTSTTTKGPHKLTTFGYLEGGKPEPALSLPAFQPPTSNYSGAMAAVPPTVPDTFKQIPENPLVSPSPCESNGLSEDEEFYGPSLRRASSVGHHMQARPTVGATLPTPTSEFPIEKQLFRILNDFMSPPESVPAKPETPSRPSVRMSPYGMGSAAAAAEPISTSPAPGSAGAKTFPTLPWNYFYTPAPVDSALRHHSSTIGAPPGWRADALGSSRPVSSGSTAQPRVGATVGNPLAYQTHNRYDSQVQPTLLKNQAEALRSLNLGSDFDSHVSQPLPSYDTRGLWSGAAGQTLATNGGMGPNHLRQDPWAPSANPWGTSQGQYPTADRPPNSPFSTLNFSSNTSSLPPVNSPWGLGAAARRLPSQGGGPPLTAPAHSPSPPNPLRAYPGASFPSSSDMRYVNQADAGAYYTAMMNERDAGASTPSVPWGHTRMPSSGANGPLGRGDT